MIKNNLAKIKYKKLGESLERKGLLTRAEFFQVLKKIEAADYDLAEQVMRKVKTEKHNQALLVLSDFFQLPAVRLNSEAIELPVLLAISKAIAQELKAVVFKKDQAFLHVASVKSGGKRIKLAIEKTTKQRVRLYLTAPADVEACLTRYDESLEVDSRYDFKEDELPVGQEAEKALAKNVPIINLVNDIIERGLSAGVSDIHIEPTRNAVLVRCRVDGFLRKVNTLPKIFLPAIVARIKILASAKIDEHMVPQDGRFRYKYKGREIAIRISIIPTLNGPKIVLRLLDASKQLLDLANLGLNPFHLKLLGKEINSPQGLILVTGPTGSGKTTTLYTILRLLNREDINICTIEDPIEYDLENVNQMQTHPRVGLTFAQGLRSLLRQDPNVIMVGEIRDPETGEIAMNAAMTGHLVLSTLHTNNAFFAPQRLTEMKIERYLVSSVANLLIGQRLVRRLCAHCKEKIGPDEAVWGEYDKKLNIVKGLGKLSKLGLVGNGLKIEEQALFRPKGCAACGHTGYQGRIGIYEIIPFDNDLRQLILKDGSELGIRALVEDRVLTMAEDGILKVLSGITTFEEVMRVTKE